jgi:GNAT superfamily N-acetyltransferase
MRADAELHDLDFASAPEEVRRAAHAIHAPALLSLAPGDEPMPYEDWCGWAERLSATADLRHVVAEVDGEMVAFGFVELTRDDNLHLAWLDVAVAEPHRHRGIGRAAVSRLLAVAADDGRTSVGWSAEEGSPAEAFAAALGLTHRQTAHVNRLAIADVDVALLEAWVAQAAERASGYRLDAWDGPTPPERVADFVACTEIMNSAPLDDLDIEDECMTPERLARLESARAAAGTEWWTLVAVEEATGAYAGFTQMSFSRGRPVLAHQNDTGVDPAHRERGLGRWLKAAMLLRVLAERPQVVHVQTHNAGSNEPMLAINHALGFRPARVVGQWQGDLDVARKHLEASA